MPAPVEIPNLFIDPPAKKVITLQSAEKTLLKIIDRGLNLKKKTSEAETPVILPLSDIFSDINKDAIVQHVVEVTSPLASSATEAANNIGFGIAYAIFRKVGKSEEWIQEYFERMQANQQKNVEIVQPIAEKIIPLIGDQLKMALTSYDGFGGTLATSLIDNLVGKVGDAYDEMRKIIDRGPANSGAQLPAEAPPQLDR